MSKTHQKEHHHKIRQKTCQNIVKKIVKQDPRGKQVPFMSPQSGFQEAPHASQGGNQLKKCSGINNILIISNAVFVTTVYFFSYETFVNFRESMW